MLYETDNRFASQYELICRLAVFSCSDLGADCSKITCHLCECVFGRTRRDADLISIVAGKSTLALTFVFFTKADVIDIGVERGGRIVST